MNVGQRVGEEAFEEVNNLIKVIMLRFGTSQEERKLRKKRINTAIKNATKAVTVLS